jgi:hypothetical protein
VSPPQGSSETAAESLLTLDDASALTAAEQLVHKLAKAAGSSSGSGSEQAAGNQIEAAAGEAMDVDAPQQQQPPQQQGSKEHQLLLGRRLLQVCMSACALSVPQPQL